MKPRRWLVLTTVAALLVLIAVLGPWTPDVLAFELGAQQLGLLAPRALALLALVPFVPYMLTRSLSRLSRARLVTSVSARMLALLGCSCALARPYARGPLEAAITIFVVDVSDSMDDSTLRDATAEIEGSLRELSKLPHHEVRLITVAAQAREIPLDPPLSLARHAHNERTDLEAGLALASSLFPEQAARRVVLISDGLETEGDLMLAASRLSALDAELLYRVPRRALPDEVAIAGVTAPREAKAGEPFRVAVRVLSTRASTATVELRTMDAHAATQRQTVELGAGANEVEFETLSHRAGALELEASVAPHSPDRFAANNRFTRALAIRGKPRILYIESSPALAQPFTRLLEAGGFDVEQRSASALPERSSELAAFDCVIVSNIPYEALPWSVTEVLEKYLQAGGALLMAGGDRGFGLGGYRGTRFEALLPVRLDTERRRDQPSLALMLVLDKSGSMTGDKLDLAKEAAQATSDLLGPDDFLGIIGFDATPTRVMRLQAAGNRFALAKGIARLTSGGGTAIFPALDAAYQDLSAVRAKLRHVILLTDGQSGEEGLPVLVRSMQLDAITVSTIGLGQDVNRSLLSELARLGGGRSYFTTDANNIPRLFVKETNAVTRSAAVEDFVTAQVVSNADFLRGVPIDRAPPLRGYVATRARPAPAQVVLASDLGEPLLARMRVGLGWSLAFTSDLTPRWSSAWLAWRPATTFWSQLLREHMRHHDETEQTLEASREGNMLVARFDALDAEEHFIHDLNGTVQATPPGSNDRVAARFTEVAPGRYEARLPLHGTGSYLLEAELDTPDGPSRATGSFSYPFPAEYAAQAPDEGRLARAAQLTGGGSAPNALTDLARRPLHPRMANREGWPWLLWFALASYLLDLTARRLRWHFKKNPY